MGSGELGADPHPIELGDRGDPSILLIDELIRFEDVAPISAAIVWEASCLRRFMRLSSSLKLFDISPSASGVSLNTEAPEAIDRFAAAAAAFDIRDDCGRIKPFLSTFFMGVHRRRFVGGRFGECKTSNGSKSKGRLSVTQAILY